MSLMRTVRWTRRNVHLVIYLNIRATSECAVSWPSARSSNLTGKRNVFKYNDVKEIETNEIIVKFTFSEKCLNTETGTWVWCLGKSEHIVKICETL